MSIIRSKKLYYINSRNRTNGENESFAYKIELPTPNYFDHVCVMQAVIPKSYYLVQEGQNTFELIFKPSISIFSWSHYIITVPPGNYTRRTFQNVLQSLLSVDGHTMTITFPEKQNESSTGKFTFSYNEPRWLKGMAFKFYDNSLFEQMGFERNKSYDFTMNANSTT